MPTQPEKSVRGVPVVTLVINCVAFGGRPCASAAGRHQLKQINREKATREEIFMRSILVDPSDRAQHSRRPCQDSEVHLVVALICCVKYFVPRCPVQSQFS